MHHDVAICIMQLTKEQRIFIVTVWMRSKSYQVVSEQFANNFPERNVPNKTTIVENEIKYLKEGTCLNLNDVQ